MGTSFRGFAFFGQISLIFLGIFQIFDNKHWQKLYFVGSNFRVFAKKKHKKHKNKFPRKLVLLLNIKFTDNFIKEFLLVE